MLASNFSNCLLLVVSVVLLIVSQGDAAILPAAAVGRLAVHRDTSRISRGLLMESTAAAAPIAVVAKTTAEEDSSGNNKSSYFYKIGPVLCSAFCAAAIMYPMDLLRALKMADAGAGTSTAQLLKNFHVAHGVKGFFTQGLLPELMTKTYTRFVKFSLFPVVHAAMFGLPPSAGSALSKTIAGFASAVPESFTIMPLEISKISLQLDSTNLYKNNMFAAIAGVKQRLGSTALFSVGLFGVLMRQGMWSAGYFSTIKAFDRAVTKAGTVIAGDEAMEAPVAKLTSTTTAGFLAGVFGAALNTPFDVVRTGLQRQVLGGSAPLTLSHLTVARDVAASKGVSSLYAGFGFKAIHLGGGGALMAVMVPAFTRAFEEHAAKQQ